MLYYATHGNYERVWHGIAMSMIFVNFQLIAGLFQVSAALLLDFNEVTVLYVFADLSSLHGLLTHLRLSILS